MSCGKQTSQQCMESTHLKQCVGSPRVTTLCSFSAAAAAAKSLQSCPTLCDPIDSSPTRLPRPWDSPGKNTGMGCHFLLQCIKVKSESEVSQSCPVLSDPMDCSLPGSSIHGIFQARVLEWGAIAFSGYFMRLTLIYSNLFFLNRVKGDQKSPFC